jgi:hypothetical protein
VEHRPLASEDLIRRESLAPFGADIDAVGHGTTALLSNLTAAGRLASLSEGCQSRPAAVVLSQQLSSRASLSSRAE